MRRTVLTWAIFAAALVLVLTVMAFFTVRIVQFERREAAADARASVEERIRLALWRMDSLAAAMLPPKQTPGPTPIHILIRFAITALPRTPFNAAPTRSFRAR